MKQQRMGKSQSSPDTSTGGRRHRTTIAMGQSRESNLYEQLDCTDEEETTQTGEGTFGIQSDVTHVWLFP